MNLIAQRAYHPSSGYGGSGTIDSLRFDFTPLTSQLSRIRYDISDLSAPGSTCAEPIDTSLSITNADKCEGIIDVLFLRSAAADSRLPTYDFVYNFKDFTQRVVDLTNTALHNSDLPGIRVNYKIHPSTVEVANNNFNVHVMLEAVIADNYIHQLRQQYDADIVSYYPDIATVNAGKAGGIRPPYARSYQVTGMREELDDYGRFTLTKHEIGHVLGGVHERGHEFFSPDTNDVPKFLRTSIIGGIHHTRIAPNYSNPEVDYTFPLGGAVPTGTQMRNNSLYMNTGACIVKDYEANGGFRSQVIAQYDKRDPCASTISLCSRVESGNVGGPNSGPYTFEWRWSIAPGVATSLLSTSSCPSFTRPFAQQSTYFITLKVTSTVSSQAVYSYQTVNFDRYCAESLPADADPTPLVIAGQDHLNNIAVPYSLSGQQRYLNLRVSGSSVALAFNVYDQLGRIVTSKSASDWQSSDFRSDVPSGLYYVSVTELATGKVLGSSAVHHIR